MSVAERSSMLVSDLAVSILTGAWMFDCGLFIMLHQGCVVSSSAVQQLLTAGL